MMKLKNAVLANEIKEYRERGYSKTRIKEILKISENKYLYLTQSDEQRAKTRSYCKKWRERKMQAPFGWLRSAILRFQRKSVCEKPFTAEDVINKFGSNPTCYLTGLAINYNDPSTYQLDHFVPVKLGGTSSLDNLMLCHPMANQMKNGYTLEDFVKFCRLIAERHPDKGRN